MRFVTVSAGASHPLADDPRGFPMVARSPARVLSFPRRAISGSDQEGRC